MRTAEIRQARLDENITHVESGRLVIPDGIDVAAFLLSDGKMNSNLMVNDGVSFQRMFDDFLDALPEGAMEKTAHLLQSTYV